MSLLTLALTSSVVYIYTMQAFKPPALLSAEQRLRIEKNRLLALERKQQREQQQLPQAPPVKPTQLPQAPPVVPSYLLLQAAAASPGLSFQPPPTPVPPPTLETLTTTDRLPEPSLQSENAPKKRVLPISFGGRAVPGGANGCSGTTVAPAAAPKRRALPSSFNSSSTEAQLPALCYSQEIQYCRTNAEAAQAVAHLRSSQALGFDIEWLVTFEQGAAPRSVGTIQLCSSDFCAVFQTSGYAAMPPELAALLADDQVLKVGVGASRDAIKVGGDLGMPVRGIVNLEDLVETKLQPTELPRGGTGGGSLAALCARVLGRSLAKPPALRLSNWEVSPLTYAQLSYAATDAYAGLRVYDVLRTWDDRPPLEVRLPSPSATISLEAPVEGAAADVPLTLCVPAKETVQKLAPAKLNVWDSWACQGWSPEQIATSRNIKLGTVRSKYQRSFLTNT